MQQFAFPLSIKSNKHYRALYEIDSALVPVLENEKLSEVKYLDWLKQVNDNKDKNTHALRVALMSSLLNDYCKALGNTKEVQNKKNKKETIKNILFYMAVIGGLIYAMCDGFDSASSIIALVTNNPWFILGGSLLVCGISVFVFAGFELSTAGKNLGVNFLDRSKFLDAVIMQQRQLKNLLKHIKQSDSVNDKPAHLQNILKIARANNTQLKQEREKIKAAKENVIFKMGKSFIGYACLIFFIGSSLFLGHSAVTSLIGLLSAIGLSIAPPVALALIITVGVTCTVGFSLIYLFGIRKEVENLVSRIVGLDRKKVEKICDSDKAQKIEDLITEVEKGLEKKSGKQEAFTGKRNGEHQVKKVHDNDNEKKERVEEHSSTVRRRAKSMSDINPIRNTSSSSSLLFFKSTPTPQPAPAITPTGDDTKAQWKIAQHRLD